jgi:hypothetical protein
MKAIIKTRYNQEVASEITIRNLLAEGKIASLKNACDILWYKYELFSVFDVVNMDYINSKSNSSIAGLLDEFRISKFNDRLLDYGLNHIGFAILSDNEPLIQSYSKLRYKRGANAELSMDEMVLQGESAIWCNTVQFFMANDFKGIERNLNIIETLTLPKLPKNQQELKLDYEFYKALLIKDKSKCEEILEQLVSPVIHKKRNDNAVLNKYVSQPALGYAKLAWRQGLEVEVNSPLVPKEILPIEPLDNYEIPYDFLKEDGV